MVIIFTGNGKGKTTAALGQSARAVGRGKKVLMIQWIKGPWQSGEEFVEMTSTKQGASGEFKLVKKGLGFVGILGDKIPRIEHKKAAVDALLFFESELRKNRWDVIILDEINVAVSLKLLPASIVLRALKPVPDDKLVVLTGRGAPNSFIKRADLVTETREIKHPFKKGGLAKIAVEF